MTTSPRPRPLKFTFPMAPLTIPDDNIPKPKPKYWCSTYLYVVCAGVTGFVIGYGTARYFK